MAQDPSTQPAPEVQPDKPQQTPLDSLKGNVDAKRKSTGETVAGLDRLGTQQKLDFSRKAEEFFRKSEGMKNLLAQFNAAITNKEWFLAAFIGAALANELSKKPEKKAKKATRMGLAPAVAARAAKAKPEIPKLEYVSSMEPLSKAPRVAGVGDSIMLGVIMSQYEKDERPPFAGEVGLSSSGLLDRLLLGKLLLEGGRDEARPKIAGKAKRWMRTNFIKKLRSEISDPAERKVALKERWPAYLAANFTKGQEDYLDHIQKQVESIRNAETVFLYTGGNNIGKDSPAKIAEDTKTIIKVLRDYLGVNNVTVCTRFPPDRRLETHPTYKNRWTPEQLKIRRARGKELRQLIIAADFGPGVKVVDLFGEFADSEGWLDKKYATGKDPLHPYGAYKRAKSLIEAA